MTLRNDLSKADAGLEEEMRRRLLWAPLAMLESGHSTFLDELRAFEALLNSLLALPRPRCGPSQIERFRRMIKFMELGTFPHMRLEEKVVFPHLSRLAPELRAPLRGLRREHQVYRLEMLRLRRHFQNLEAAPARAATVRQFCDKGLDIIALLRAHIATENHLVTTIPAGMRVRPA